MNAEPGGDVFAAAVQWLDATLLGTIATTVGVIAVATVGFMMISGRIDVRRAAQVLLGCFILFGASSIAGGLIRVLEGESVPAHPATTPPPLATPALTKPAAPNVPYDPYAGAALPSR